MVYANGKFVRKYTRTSITIDLGSAHADSGIVMFMEMNSLRV